MMLRSRWWALKVFGLLAWAGCGGGGKVNIGNVDSLGGTLSDYAAQWDGHAQAFAFGDGTDGIHITLDPSGHGTVRFGNAAAPAAPVDPQVGYPPPSATGSTGTFPATPGFPYPAHAATVAAHRIQLGVDTGDLYAAWCALQTPGPSPFDGDDSFTCGPKVNAPVVKYGHELNDKTCTITDKDGGTQTANCDWLDLCWVYRVCECTATACRSLAQAEGTPVSQYPLQIDGELDDSGMKLTGSIGPTRINVILERTK